MRIAMSNRRLATIPLLLLLHLVVVGPTRSQTPATPAASPSLFFWADPQTQLFGYGEPVTVMLTLYNGSEEPLFVSRLTDGEFVHFDVAGPDGKQVPWQGKRPIDSKQHSPSDFVVIPKYHEISAKRIISFDKGAGFIFDKFGQYSITAEYSLGPGKSFVSFAGKAKIPTGSFHSKAAFCIEACILEPLPVHNNASQASLHAVHVFYSFITQYRPLGIPKGAAKKTLWPLLSKRLARELDNFQACDDDYYRRYGHILEANHYKPATPWLEEGLFSGPNEVATVTKFSVLDSRAIGENRVDVHLRFTPTDCCDDLMAHEHYDGIVSVIRENHHWVVDDFVPMYGNDDLHRLSEGYPAECKAGRWIGEPAY